MVDSAGKGSDDRYALESDQTILSILANGFSDWFLSGFSDSCPRLDQQRSHRRGDEQGYCDAAEDERVTFGAIIDHAIGEWT
jgi:hypothetical protein